MLVCCLRVLIGMQSPDWKYTETVQKRIRVIKVNRQERHLDAQDVDAGVPFCLDAEEGLDLGKVKQAKIYKATIKVYFAELNSGLEQELYERSISDAQLRHSLRVLKASGSDRKSVV
jgi:hypothetical protein